MRHGLFRHSLRAFSGVIYASQKVLAEVAPGLLAQNVGAYCGVYVMALWCKFVSLIPYFMMPSIVFFLSI